MTSDECIQTIVRNVTKEMAIGKRNYFSGQDQLKRLAHYTGLWVAEYAGTKHDKACALIGRTYEEVCKAILGGHTNVRPTKWKKDVYKSYAAWLDNKRSRGRDVNGRASD